MVTRSAAIEHVSRWHTEEDADRFRARGWWSDRCLFEIVDEWAERTGDKLAVTDGTYEWTYAQLRDTSLRAAQVLHDLGVRPGDAVTVQIPSSALIPALHSAVNRLGAVFVPVPEMWRASEVEAVVRGSRASVLLVPAGAGFDHLAMAREIQAGLPHLGCVMSLTGADSFMDRVAVARPDLAAIAALRPSPDEVLSVICSSGTTGVPKLSAFSSNNVLTNMSQVADAIGMGQDDVMGGIAPANTGSTGYLYGVLGPLVVGATAHVLGRWSARAAADLLSGRGCTVAVAIPTQIVMLMDPALGDHDYTPLRAFLNGGAALPVSVATTAEERMGCAVLGIYGASESAFPTCGRHDDPPDKRQTTVGRVVPGQELRLVDGDGIDVPPGESGEVLWRGPNSSFGFLNQPELDASAFDGSGFFHSADLGVLDEDGYLLIVGRLKDMILRGGLNIYPAEVEGLLYEMPKVADAAVVGVPDDRLGERACAVVVLADRFEALEVAEVSAFLEAAGLARFKHPEFVVAVAELPRAASAKLDKSRIRDMARQLIHDL
ncbi:class I adenylate-forming enzyme family protein [Pseudonocardia sp. GCM10023141]|uniref:class I adenylate-forming enzyme family protein n=1 Tax=Pseudonocardia sp. GCM10023141 TaxID=3252653 RepID=UPI0036112A06